MTKLKSKRRVLAADPDSSASAQPTVTRLDSFDHKIDESQEVSRLQSEVARLSELNEKVSEVRAEIEAKASKSEVAIAELRNELDRLAELNKSLTEDLARERQTSVVPDEVRKLALANAKLAADLRHERSISQRFSTIQSENSKLKIDGKRHKDQLAKMQGDLDREKAAIHVERDEWRRTKADLSERIQGLEQEVQIARSSIGDVDALDRISSDRIQTMEILIRVSELWSRTDRSIRDLGTAVQGILSKEVDETSAIPSTSGSEYGMLEGGASKDHVAAMSTAETASLVYSEVKVSLMLIELRMRNHLACLRNDQTALRTFSSVDDSQFRRAMDGIRDKTLRMIARVDGKIEEQMNSLQSMSTNETQALKELLEERSQELEQMQLRQEQLEQRITKLKDANQSRSLQQRQHGVQEGNDDQMNGESNGAGPLSASAVELFVSRRALEQLQSEVIQIIERLAEKNEAIGRLEATVEEHIVREKTLMDELQRFVREQAARENADRERLMHQSMASFDDPNDSDDTGKYLLSWKRSSPIRPLLIFRFRQFQFAMTIPEFLECDDSTEYVEEQTYYEEVVEEEFEEVVEG
jgi:DNA repair exonuclease SbcCD ATPase subunit